MRSHSDKQKLAGKWIIQIRSIHDTRYFRVSLQRLTTCHVAIAEGYSGVITGALHSVEGTGPRIDRQNNTFYPILDFRFKARAGFPRTRHAF